MRTTLGKSILKILSTLSNWISETGKDTIRKEVEIEKSKAEFANASGIPTPINIGFKISSKTPLYIQVSAVNFRIGFAEHGMTIQNFTWCKQISSEPPANIDLHDIEPKRSQWQQIEMVLPEYLYFENASRQLHLDGSIMLDTVFGPVEVPIKETLPIDKELESVEDTREFFSGQR